MPSYEFIGKPKTQPSSFPILSNTQKMDASKQLEGREVCYHRDDHDGIDPDTAFSYLDEKIQRVLGHFQKDFEGDVSTENLGARSGGYGSFLPSYENPPSIWPQKINQQRDCKAARSRNNLHLKGSFQNSKAPPPKRHVAMKCNASSSHYNYLPKDETLSDSGNLMKKRSLKGGTDSTAQKNAAIYRELGLDGSPMSSPENNTGVSEKMVPRVQSPRDESPTKIIQEMTSVQVPGGALISPLHDSLLWLSRKEKPIGETKSVLSLEDHEECLPKLVNETISLQNQAKLKKEKKREAVHKERQVNLKKAYTCLDKEKTVLNPASKVEPTVKAPVDVEENWVCCDSCQKWRLLPFETKPKQLPQKWFCYMQHWLLGMNRCDISEKETAEKFNALYQLPFSESANALQNCASGPASTDNHHLDQNLGLQTRSNQGKEQYSLKERKKSRSSNGEFRVESSLKNHQQKSRKRSLNGLSRPPSNQLRKSMGSASELHNLAEGNKLKKFIDGGSSEELKTKNKRPGGNGLCPRPVKKSKTEDMCTVDNQQGFTDLNASTLDSMKSSCQTASNKLKEAKSLRDYADRLKNSGLGFESCEFYFQSALKFLHGAYLLETGNKVSGKHGDKTHTRFYGITAELCEFCACEYEKRQEMAAAALAYKCIEVAYMRLVFYQHSNTDGDWHEMYSSLRTDMQGESPSSPASEVDNLINQATKDKAIFNKGGGSLVDGRHNFNAGNPVNFVQLLDIMRDMNLAIEASKKSQNALVAASAYFKRTQNGDCVASVKKVIDFSFQDVEQLIHLLRPAMEAITQSSSGKARD